MTSKTDESVFKLGRPIGHMLPMTSSDGERWYYGCVLTKHGAVYVHAEPAFTTMQVVHDGYVVSRTAHKSYTSRGLVTLAVRFAEEICG